MKKYNLLISDIETTAVSSRNDIQQWATLEGVDELHCMSILNAETKELFEFNSMKDNIREGLEMLKQAEYVVFHNGIGFDVPALYKLYGIRIPKVIDTKLMAQVICPDIKDSDDSKKSWKHLKGSQSLKAWGVRLGNWKGDYGENEDAEVL